MARPRTREAAGDYVSGDLRDAPLTLDRHGPARVTIVPIGGGRQQAAYGYTDKLQDEVVAAIKAEDAKPCAGTNPHVMDGDVIRCMLSAARTHMHAIERVVESMPAERQKHFTRELSDISNSCGMIVKALLRNAGVEWNHPLISHFDLSQIVSEGGYGHRSQAARQHT